MRYYQRAYIAFMKISLKSWDYEYVLINFDHVVLRYLFVKSITQSKCDEQRLRTAC